MRLLDLWIVSGWAALTSPDRIRRIPSVQLAIVIPLFGRPMVINVLFNWLHLGPLAAFLMALTAMTPVDHLIWHPTRG